jgi:hypothetical protein
MVLAIMVPPSTLQHLVASQEKPMDCCLARIDSRSATDELNQEYDGHLSLGVNMHASNGWKNLL